MLFFSMLFQFLAAYLSFRFVLLGRLGKPWILVSSALLIVGGLRVYALALQFAEPDPASIDPTLQVIEFAVSFMLGVGFALTERWYLLKERLERRFRLIADVDRALIGLLEEEKILSTVCEGLVRDREYQLAWIGSAEPDGSISPGKAAGEGLGFLSEIPLRWDETPAGSCPPGMAIRTGKVCVINRMQTDPWSGPWRAAAGKHGIRSFASVRIDIKKTPPKVLSLGSRRENAFDRLEMESVAAMACRVGTALFSARRHELFVCAKQSYNELIQSQRDGVVLVRGGAIVRINPAAVRSLGYISAEELLGKDPTVLFPETQGDPPAFARLFQTDSEGPEPFVITKMQRKNGSLFEAEITSTWVPRTTRNEEWDVEYSGPLGMFIFRDVTLRAQTLEELRKERDFSSKVLDVAAVLVLQVGPEGEILLFNRQCEEATGFTAAEAIGRKLADILLAEGTGGFPLQSFEEVLDEKPLPAREFALRTKSGEERIVVWNCAPIRTPDGKVGSILAAGTDVTERRRLERRFLGMQKMEAVGTLAGGVAHDFNNLLTGILGNLDLARKHLSPIPEALAPVEESIRASERAAGLVRQLLEFSRKTALDRKATDVGEVVREVVRLVSETVDGRIRVTDTAADDLWPADMDADQVRRMLMSLCANARDAVRERLEDGGTDPRETEEKWIRVGAANVTIGGEYCRIHPYARPGEFVVLSVADNGSGMDEVTKRRAFEPFFTSKNLGRGTGLGLSAVYGIVKQHEGWITLDSEPETGTTFLCYFPRSAKSAQQERGVPSPKLSAEEKETILIVDDEEMIRDLGTQILTTRGYKVLTAADGPQAVAMYLAGKDTIDLVILDLTMPHMSGLDVLERIRKINPRAKIVLSSGHRGDEALNPDRFSGASGFLPKPYRADLLVGTVRGVLDSDRS